jgi:hypothetical protein
MEWIVSGMMDVKLGAQLLPRANGASFNCFELEAAGMMTDGLVHGQRIPNYAVEYGMSGRSKALHQPTRLSSETAAVPSPNLLTSPLEIPKACLANLAIPLADG